MRALVAIVLLVAADAHAEPPRVIVSLPVFAVSSHALAVQAEMPVARRWSAVAAIAGREGAHSDYDSVDVGVAAEARLWRTDEQRAWFAGARVELLVTRLSMGERSLGTSSLLDEGLVGGYRFVPWREVEITPTLGIALRHDLGAPAATRLTPWYGVTLGWRFR